jgi:hypothetical protein
MPLPKPLTKEQIIAAMSQTKSNRSAARYLNVSYQHYKKWAKLYKGEDNRTLFEIHFNQKGVGIPKFLKNSQKIPALQDLLEGRVPMTNFSPEKVKKRLFEEGYLQEKCDCCGFEERRILDYKVPLIMHFKDNNKKNYRLENLEMLCYNCYFLIVGNIFTDKQIEQMEEHKPINHGHDADWQLDDYQAQRLKELGLYNPPKSDLDDLNIVSHL